MNSALIILRIKVMGNGGDLGYWRQKTIITPPVRTPRFCTFACRPNIQSFEEILQGLEAPKQAQTTDSRHLQDSAPWLQFEAIPSLSVRYLWPYLRWLYSNHKFTLALMYWRLRPSEEKSRIPSTNSCCSMERIEAANWQKTPAVFYYVAWRIVTSAPLSVILLTSSGVVSVQFVPQFLHCWP